MPIKSYESGEPEKRRDPLSSNAREFNRESIGARRMLLVGDDLNLRALIKGIFDGKYEVLESDGRGAIDAVKRSPYLSVIVLKLALPDDGFTVLKYIRGDEGLSEIPVIGVIGADSRQTVIRAMECGANDCVTEPIDVDLTRLKVDSAVTRAESERIRALNGYIKLRRDEEMKYRTVLESAGTVVIEYDCRDRSFHYDDIISRHIAGNYDNRALWDILLDDAVMAKPEVEEFKAGVVSFERDGEESCVPSLVSLKTPSGVMHWFRANFYKRSDEYGRDDKMIITFNDVHDEVLANERLLFQATRDELTGLYNRSGFLERARALISEREPGYYVMSCMDIEEFKIINDQYGTQKGDEVLRRFADVLSRVERECGAICCRVTADNFAILFPKSLLGTDDIKRFHRDCERLDASLPELKIYAGRYYIDDKSMDVRAIFDRAAMAKYTVKGRFDVNVATYDESMRTAILRQQEITSHMNAALSEGEFEVWLQPQFNHATQALTGAEALVRWRRPGEGIVSPTEFIPIFEKNGFVYELDKFVWEKSCLFLREWLDKGLKPVPVSVNISRMDVFRDDIIDVITGLVKKYSLPIELLRLEITESAFSKSTSQIIRVVEKFVEIGFVVEIDDFGSGYSSLNTLKDVPAQVLKMDMRFLENDSNAQRGGTIIESVVRMARWLGMSVIAEGVETPQQADYLKSIGCDYIQGFLYSMPIRKDQFESILAARDKEMKPPKPNIVRTWNNNAFWNPKSVETLIFNSYVGGACIFEYHNGKTELLRYNDSYVEILGSHFKSASILVHSDLFTDLDEENAGALRRNIDQAIDTQKESSCEIRITGDDKQTLFIRVTLRQIAVAGDNSLFYCVINDVTPIYEERRKRNDLSNELRLSRKEQTQTAGKLTAVMNSVQNGITAVVLRGDEAEFILANEKFYALHGVSRDEFKHKPLSECMRLIHPLDRDSVEKKIKDSRFPGARAEAEYRVALPDGSITWVKAILSVTDIEGVDLPVQVTVYSDITLEKESSDQLNFLNDSARDILAQPDCDIAVNYSLKKLMAYFEADRGYVVELDHEKGLSNNTYEVCDDNVVSEMDKLQGIAFSRDEFWFNALSNNEYYVIGDVNGLGDGESRLRDLLLSQGIRSMVLAPLWSDGLLMGFVGVDNPKKAVDQVKRLTAMGDIIAMILIRRNLIRKIKRDGETISELQGRLLDNLPSGCALYEYDGKTLRVIHINKRYWELVGRESADYSKASVFAMIHPDDKNRVRLEVDSAIKQLRNIAVDFRVLCGDGSYKAFHVTANVSPEKDGKYLFYASYAPISEREMTLQRMMPLVFPAMMEASTDITFAKDVNLKYLCSSRAYTRLLGLGDDESIVGKTDYDLFGDRIADAIVESDRKLMAGGEPVVDRKMTVPSADGIPHYLRLSKYLLRDTVGNALGIYGIGRDITQRQNTSDQLKLFTNTIPGGLATFAHRDGVNRLTYFNDGLCALFGCDRDEFNGDALESYIFEEDRSIVLSRVKALVENGKSIDCVYRIRVKDGGYKWINEKAIVADRVKGWTIINAVFLDVTRQQEEKERLLVSEQFNRIAIAHSGSIITSYDVLNRTLTLPDSFNAIFELPHVLNGMPYEQIRLNRVSEDTADVYIKLFEDIASGSATGTVAFKQNSKVGWRWLEAQYTTIFSNAQKPVSAVISFTDITEKLEKEVVYNKWQQSLANRSENSYTLFRCNISKNGGYDSREGKLLNIVFDNAEYSFDERTEQYASRYVFKEDYDGYIAFLDSNVLLANYYRGQRSGNFEYRELTGDGEYRWLRLSVDLVEYPNSKDVEAYLMYEDIDEQKKNELLTLERSETDPLTGILNRTTFISRMEKILSESKPGERHALFMLDIDDFKRVNDTLGHGAGDFVLKELTKRVESLLSPDDLMGRLGGDEFFVFYKGVKDENDAAKKAEGICSLNIAVPNSGKTVSVSIGIALIPENGENFAELYKKIDAALYSEKRHGKGGYCFIAATK